MKREASDEAVFSDQCSSRGKSTSNDDEGSVRIITTYSSQRTVLITNHEAASLNQDEDAP